MRNPWLVQGVVRGNYGGMEHQAAYRVYSRIGGYRSLFSELLLDMRCATFLASQRFSPRKRVRFTTFLHKHLWTVGNEIMRKIHRERHISNSVSAHDGPWDVPCELPNLLIAAEIAELVASLKGDSLKLFRHLQGIECPTRRGVTFEVTREVAAALGWPMWKMRVMLQKLKVQISKHVEGFDVED